MLMSPRRCMTRVLMVLGIAVIAATGTPAIADEHDSGAAVSLSLRPVDQSGAYFDLTLEAGETQDIQAELTNNGSESVDVRTYPANVFTLINGGFGAEERDGEPTGTTAWLDYSADVLPLAAGATEVRSFTVEVPEDTEPGEYITSVVLENDVPIEGSGTVALNQIMRQALPVTIRVPGPLEHDFEFGAASHQFVADQSVVGVEITNTGNANLAPAGDITIRNDAGDVVGEAESTMNTFFAGTETKVETALENALDPGDYTLDVSMTDEESGANATARDVPFTVEGEPLEDVTPDSEDNTDSGVGLLVYLLAAAVVILLLTVVFMLVRNHRRQKADEDAAPMTS